MGRMPEGFLFVCKEYQSLEKFTPINSLMISDRSILLLFMWFLSAADDHVGLLARKFLHVRETPRKKAGSLCQ